MKSGISPECQATEILITMVTDPYMYGDVLSLVTGPKSGEFSIYARETYDYIGNHASRASDFAINGNGNIVVYKFEGFFQEYVICYPFNRISGT
jgi:hypothetical protein